MAAAPPRTVAADYPRRGRGAAATPRLQELTHRPRRYVSQNTATRDDLDSLSKQLDALLRDQQARASGICHIRSHLFAQLFDELIRQITLDQPLLGLLLLRVRDEGRMFRDATVWVHFGASDFGRAPARDTRSRLRGLSTSSAAAPPRLV